MPYLKASTDTGPNPLEIRWGGRASVAENHFRCVLERSCDPGRPWQPRQSSCSLHFLQRKNFIIIFFRPPFLYTPFFTVFHLIKLGSYKSQWRKWRTLTRPTQCRLYNSAKGSVMTLQSLWSRIDSNCKSLPSPSLFIVDFKNIFAAHMCCYYFPYWSGFDFVNTWLGRGMKFRRVISSKKTTTSAPNQDQRYKAAGSRQHEIMNCTDSACQAQEDNRRGNRIELWPTKLARQNIIGYLNLSLSLFPYIHQEEKSSIIIRKKSQSDR